jgi:hypothetical protein
MPGRMTIKGGKTVISAAVGLIEIGAKQVDTAVPPIGGLVKVSEGAELAMTLGSLAGNYMGYQPEKTEVLFYSSLPLFEVMVANRILAAMVPAAVAPPAGGGGGGTTPRVYPTPGTYRV